MPNNDQPDLLDFDLEPKPRPELLNILTILTFIGCGILLLSATYGYFRAPAAYEKILATQDKMQNAPGFIKEMTGPGIVEIARKKLEYRLAILLIELAGGFLCAYGAVEMRALKKEGFIWYAGGEVLPLIAVLILIGMGSFSVFQLTFMALTPLVFLALYASQWKHLH